MSGSTGFLQPVLESTLPWLYHESRWWEGLGLVGQILFGSRFLVQWLMSERKKRIVVPPAFWYLSFFGSLFTLFYAFHTDKLPFILGNLLLPFIYARNLRLLLRPAGETPADPS